MWCVIVHLKKKSTFQDLFLDVMLNFAARYVANHMTWWSSSNVDNYVLIFIYFIKKKLIYFRRGRVPSWRVRNCHYVEMNRNTSAVSIRRTSLICDHRQWLKMVSWFIVSTIMQDIHVFKSNDLFVVSLMLKLEKWLNFFSVNIHFYTPPHKKWLGIMLYPLNFRVRLSVHQRLISVL